MATDSDNLRLHRTQILDLLALRGLAKPRVPHAGPDHDPDMCEIVVAVSSTTTILDLAAAERELAALLGHEIDVVPEGSERAVEVGASAVAL